jgi:hypothetical protein
VIKLVASEGSINNKSGNRPGNGPGNKFSDRTGNKNMAVKTRKQIARVNFS